MHPPGGGGFGAGGGGFGAGGGGFGGGGDDGGHSPSVDEHSKICRICDTSLWSKPPVRRPIFSPLGVLIALPFIGLGAYAP